MFTGIVTEVGEIVHTAAAGRGRQLEIRAARTASGLVAGGSVSVNGCCLSAEGVEGERFRLHATPETLRRTTLGGLGPGAGVNLELPLRPEDRIGGHFVQGHVDGVGEVREVLEVGGSWVFAFQAPREVLPYIVLKGSVAVDGISLTVAGLHAGVFRVAVIPETWSRTTLSRASVGTRVNLEADILAKYVEGILVPRGGDRDRFREAFRAAFGGPSQA